MVWGGGEGGGKGRRGGSGVLIGNRRLSVGIKTKSGTVFSDIYIDSLTKNKTKTKKKQASCGLSCDFDLLIRPTSFTG